MIRTYSHNYNSSHGFNREIWVGIPSYITSPCSNSSDISDYVNMAVITWTQHYTRLAWNRFPEPKMLGNDRMETLSTAVMSIRRRDDIEKYTWRTQRYFVNFESRTTSNRYHNFHVDSLFKIDEILTNFPRGISMSNQWRIDEEKSIGWEGEKESEK